MIYYVYILRNDETDRYYIGSTNDLNRRLKQHKHGYTRTTRILKTDQLVYLKKFASLIEARQEEKRLKRSKNKNYLRWLITNINDLVAVAQR